MGDFHEYLPKAAYERNVAAQKAKFDSLAKKNPNCKYIIFSELPNVQRILTKNDSRENMATYSFWTNEQIVVKPLSAGKIEITSYFLEPIKDVSIGCVSDASSSKKEIVVFDEIQPLSRVTIDVNELQSNRFEVSSPDPLFQKVKAIRMRTKIAFILPESAPKDGKLGNIPLTPIHAREWIFMMTNYANLISAKEYEEKLYSLQGQLFDDSQRKHYLSKEELHALYEKMMSYPQLNVGIMQGATGLGSSKARTLSIKERALLTFHKKGGALALLTHEFSHCLGYKHENGNMVVAVNEKGERVKESEAVNFSSSPLYVIDEIGDERWRIYPDYHLLETYALFWKDYFHFPTAENGVKYPAPK